VGEYTREVLGQLGYDAMAVARLAAENVVYVN
jgi:hypothetical protein